VPLRYCEGNRNVYRKHRLSCRKINTGMGWGGVETDWAVTRWDRDTWVVVAIKSCPHETLVFVRCLLFP